MLRIGVLLPATFASAGEFLADASALDAAGAYAVIVEGASTPAFIALAAVAAVTHRIKVGCVKDEAFGVESLAALNRVSGGRALVFDRGVPPQRLTVRDAEPVEAWLEVALPDGRAAWKQALAAHESYGVAGLIVPWDPRLIDLLRNSDEDDDRGDLVMSTG